MSQMTQKNDAIETCKHNSPHTYTNWILKLVMFYILYLLKQSVILYIYESHIQTQSRSFQSDNSY